MSNGTLVGKAAHAISMNCGHFTGNPDLPHLTGGQLFFPSGVNVILHEELDCKDNLNWKREAAALPKLDTPLVSEILEDRVRPPLLCAQPVEKKSVHS